MWLQQYLAEVRAYTITVKLVSPLGGFNHTRVSHFVT